MERERGYVYFQDFIPGNTTDTRVLTVKDKAIACRRVVRKGDFRASGSGRELWDPQEIDLACIKIAFDISQKLNIQCLTFDFIHLNDSPVILEISFSTRAPDYLPSPGYWDQQLKFHEGTRPFPEYIIDNLL